MPKVEGEKNKNLINGMVYGLGGAVVLVIIILLIVFRGSIFNLKGGNDQNADGSADPAKLRITVIAKEDCEKCFNINLVTEALRQRGIEELGNETIDMNDTAAKQLIEKYNITQLPTVLIAGELDKDPNLQDFWLNLGEIIDGVFVFRQVIPPYIDVATGELRGLVSVTLLDDASCEECYDVTLHRNALTNLGVTAGEEKIVDVATDEGKALVEKYDIDLVPTILLSGEVDEYINLSQIWPTYGTIADDGTYIFTGVDVMGTYKSLVTGKVTVVEVPEAAQPLPVE